MENPEAKLLVILLLRKKETIVEKLKERDIEDYI